MPSDNGVTRILIVEDSLSDLDLIKEAISELPEFQKLETVAVSSLGEALRILAEDSADVILLDLGLPDSQGLDTLRRMRSRLTHVPIIVFTSIYSKEIGLEAVRIGAQDYLVKGEASGESLTHAIHCAIVRHQSPEHQAGDSVDRELNTLHRLRDSLKPVFGQKD